MDLAVFGPVDAGQGVEEGRFAGPIGPDDRADLAFINPKFILLTAVNPPNILLTWLVSRIAINAKLRVFDRWIA